MMRVSSVAAMQALRDDLRAQGRSVGFVPTMGALHDGHGALVLEASKHHDEVVVSVFVNPTQFGPTEDFDRYPRNLDRDADLIAQYGGTVLFAPTTADMYPKGATSNVEVGLLGSLLDGEHRPGHFAGVATVVKRLFDVVQPHAAYFGAKDYQQTLVVKAMVVQQGLATNVVVRPTVREADGLAMSSRNAYLSSTERQHATALYRALQAARATVTSGERSANAIQQAMKDVLLSVPELTLDYAVAVNADDLATTSQFAPGQQIVCLIAARLGSTRLIDNALMHIP
jgi:pantoate--beta-alanine ligase